MAVANKIPPHDHVVHARKINRRFALIVLAFKQFVVFNCDVMRLVEFDQVQTIIVL